MEKFSIERCIKPKNFGDVKTTELHHFSDASEVGYGAVTYIRQVNQDGKIHCSFGISKSRLAPMKPITMPRLELSAAAVAVKLDKMMRRELDIRIDRSMFWTDSTAVLKYIKNENKRFQVFVANRLAVIYDGTQPTQWSYIESSGNPADDTSRGLSVHELLKGERWINGPEFIWQDTSRWPRTEFPVDEISQDDPEVKKSTISCGTKARKVHSMTDLIFAKYSVWTDLKKAVAWILRYKHWLKMKAKKDEASIEKGRTGKLLVEDLREAEDCIIRCVQQECYENEMMLAKDGVTPVGKSSCLRSLNPILKHDLLCVGGRLKHMPDQFEALKNPVILPKRHHIVDILIRHYHLQSGHSGIEYVLSKIRENYWIVKGRVSVRRVLGSCFDCRRRFQRPNQQKMADLPPDRIVPDHPPFTFVGVDCFGPFMVKRGRAMVKRYGVLFTCLTMRAVHIEVAQTMETDSFINALRRFMARRGKPAEMRSDNGTNFKGGNRELSEAIKQWNHDKLNVFCLQEEIKWHFNPPHASHMGGAWERSIRTVRKVLSGLLKEQVLDDEGLRTLLCEVESIINGRPLTKVSDDPRDVAAITPNHLLLLKSNHCMPPGIFSKSDCYGKRRWKQVQYLADIFWKRWIKEYLPTLQKRQKWHEVKRNLAKDDVVLVVDETLPQGNWPIARVLETKAGRDGLVRSVKVKTPKSEFIRPISKLCLLEAADARFCN